MSASEQPFQGRPRIARGGAFVAATWLIGLGLIFLIRDYAGWSWTEAWPMFVILVGVGMLASSFAHARRQWAGSWWLVWPVAWMGIGFVLLMSTTGRLGVTPGDLVSQWWPIVPIGIGIWFLVASIWPGRQAAVEQLDIPLEGAAQARIRIRFGAGQLEVGRAPAGRLVAGTFSGGVAVAHRDPGTVELEPDTAGPWPVSASPFDWRLGVTGEVPLELRVETGAAKSNLDLEDTQLRHLDLKTGASDTRVRLPRAAGVTTVRAEAGAAALTIEIPPGVAARIQSQMALGSTSVTSSTTSPCIGTRRPRCSLRRAGSLGCVRTNITASSSARQASSASGS